MLQQARAIIGKPDIILADEPTSSLDIKASNQLLELLLNKKMPDTSVLMVSHDTSLKEQFQKHISLEPISYAH